MENMKRMERRKIRDGRIMPDTEAHPLPQEVFVDKRNQVWYKNVPIAPVGFYCSQHKAIHLGQCAYCIIDKIEASFDVD